MNALYGYIAAGMLAALIAVGAGGFFYGHHVGEAAGAKTLAQVRAAWATEAANEAQQTAAAQKAADARTIATLQAAVQNAAADTAARDKALAQTQTRVRTLEARLASYGKNTTERSWLLDPIPASIVGSLCYVAADGRASAACNGNQD